MHKGHFRLAWLQELWILSASSQFFRSCGTDSDRQIIDNQTPENVPSFRHAAPPPIFAAVRTPSALFWRPHDFEKALIAREGCEFRWRSHARDDRYGKFGQLCTY